MVCIPEASDQASSLANIFSAEQRHANGVLHYPSHKEPSYAEYSTSTPAKSFPESVKLPKSNENELTSR